MMQQKDMESSMLKTHRKFISGLEESLDILKDNINEVEGISQYVGLPRPTGILENHPI